MKNKKRNKSFQNNFPEKPKETYLKKDNEIKTNKNEDNLKLIIRLLNPFFLIIILNLFKYSPNPIFEFYNSYGMIQSIFVNYTKVSMGFYEKMQTNIKKFDDFINRSFNNYISWCENVVAEKPFDKIFTEERMNQEAVRSKGLIYRVSNVTVNEGTTFAYKNHFMVVRNQYWSGWFDFQSGYITFVADKALILGHYFCRYNFGHIIHDYMVPLAYFPDDIVENVYIISQSNENYTMEFFKVFGIRENQIILLPKDAWVKCNTLYVIDRPSPTLAYYGYGARRFHALCVSYFNLTDIKPMRYALINRNSLTRRIKNFKEIIEQCNLIYPEYNWTEMNDYYETLRETACVWATFKVAFMPTGSNVAKVYFMHPKTVICVGEANIVDYSPMKDAAAIDVFSRWFCFPSMEHRQEVKEGWEVNVSLVIENIKYALYASKYQNWPSSRSFTI